MNENVMLLDKIEAYYPFNSSKKRAIEKTTLPSHSAPLKGALHWHSNCPFSSIKHLPLFLHGFGLHKFVKFSKN